MTATALMPTFGKPLLQSLSEKAEDESKRLGENNVPWPSEDKCQVRLFAVEDAPSFSGTILQELYEAKQTSFMHASVPVSLDDLPPGFEGVAVKRASLDNEAIAAMMPQIPWHCPPKFIFEPSWQVVFGEETTEVDAQRKREVRVLEAVYPRISAIPSGPAEPSETPQNIGDAHVLEIPLMPVEDDEEGMEDESLAPGTPFLSFSVCVDSENNKTLPTSSTIPSGRDFHKVGSIASVRSSSLAISKVNQSLVASLLKDADLNVAAAAASAYAAVKAMESGRMIDHDLLMKILGNPVLLEILSAASQKLKIPMTAFTTSPLKRLVANGSNTKMNNQQVGSLSKAQSMPATSDTSHDSQNSAASGQPLQGVQGPPKSVVWSGLVGGGCVTRDRAFNSLAAHEQSTRMGGIGTVSGAVVTKSQPFGLSTGGRQVITQPVAPPSSRPLAPRHDYLKELIQQHGMAQSNNGNPALDERNLILNGDRTMAMGVGPRADLSNRWPGNDQIHPLPLPSRNLRDDGGAEVVRIKPWKPCIYFNSPRGCRNGANCTFLHESSTEKRPERTRVDVSQPQQVKRLRVEIGSEVKGLVSCQNVM